MVLLACLSLSAMDLVWQPRPDDNLVRLANFLREQSPEVLDAQVLAEAAEGQLAWTQVYPNPNLHLRVGNIPVGPTNPAGLRPGDQVMSYGFSLDYKIELNKRGHRQEQHRWLVNARKAHVALVLRERALALGRVLGRMGVLQIAQKSVKDALTAAEAHAADNDKLALVAMQLKQRSLELDAQVLQRLAECSSIVAIKCQAFVSAEDARAFLDRWATSVPSNDDTIEKRWDIREMDAEKKAAEAAKSLYSWGALPDPTLSFGYVHDRLTIGGNQPNTFMVGLSVPLSFFDRGQAQSQAAAAMANRLTLRRQRAIEAGHESVRALRAALAAEVKRLALIESELVPRTAKAWVAAASGGQEIGFAERMLTETSRAHADALANWFDASLDLLAALPGE